MLRHVSPRRLVMPAAFVSFWTTLTALGVADDTAFVWSAVLAQAVQVWLTMPISVRRHHQTFGRAEAAVPPALYVIIALMAAQVWWCEPLFTQRLVSLYCAGFAAAMMLGLRGDADILDRFAPDPDGSAPSGARRDRLRKAAAAALAVLATNEVLIAAQAPLHVVAATFAVLPVALQIALGCVSRPPTS